jgi:hypothetical protein
MVHVHILCARDISPIRSQPLELVPQITRMRNLGMIDVCQLRFLDPDGPTVVRRSVQQQSRARSAFDNGIAPIG